MTKFSWKPFPGSWVETFVPRLHTRHQQRNSESIFSSSVQLYPRLRLSSSPLINNKTSVVVYHALSCSTWTPHLPINFHKPLLSKKRWQTIHNMFKSNIFKSEKVTFKCSSLRGLKHMNFEACCWGMKVSDEYFKPYYLLFFRRMPMNTH